MAKAAGDYRLPTATEEAEDPVAADADYAEATRLVIARSRNSPHHRLLNVENRNYGFARNLYGLKTFGLWMCAIAEVATVILIVVVVRNQDLVSATPLFVPLLVPWVGLVLWLHVDPDFVRPQAEAYADRFLEAAKWHADAAQPDSQQQPLNPQDGDTT